MKQGTPVSRGLAASIAVVMIAFGLPVGADGAADASVHGSVVVSSDRAPIAEATVHVGDPASGRVYSSAATNPDGSFSIDGLPAATYQVAVETGDRLYVIDTPVELAPGVTRNATLVVDPQVAPDPATANASGSAGIWGNPAAAAAIVIGGAFVIGLALDEVIDDDNPGPPPASGSSM